MASMISRHFSAAAPSTAGAFAGVKHVVMRAGLNSADGVLSLTTERRSPAIAGAAAQLAAAVPGVGGISNSYELSNANAVIGRRMDFVWGEREMEETIEGVRFRVSPASFFQINGEMVAAIFRALNVTTRVQAVIDAKAQGYEGDSCPECGAMTMVRNGSCLKCVTCGSTSGCS